MLLSAAPFPLHALTRPPRPPLPTSNPPTPPTPPPHKPHAPPQIKPSNLLLTSDGTAKLADLGFTVALDANGQTVGCCGTTGYIAPEVYAYGSSKTRSSYGVPADIWSAAATLFQVLTGSVVTDRPEEVLKKGWRPPTHPRFSPQLQVRARGLGVWGSGQRLGTRWRIC